MLWSAMTWVQLEGSATTPIKVMNAQTDYQNHRNSVHSLKKKRCSGKPTKLCKHCLKSSGEGSLGIFQQVAEIIRACFEFILQLLIGSINSIVSLVFDAVTDIITGSVSATGSMAAELAEKLKTSFEESLKQVPELIEEVFDMMSNMVTDLWNNYKEAVGYVTGNV
ncbi:unnamed protein product [Vicia faba]|uniref:Uncharacterized protein n=1 Tax=Vicia faba TaxID=3906 RepID=A0AAV1AVI2_VICFA|nr:unnamed protein product [Vicia faba]